MLKNEVKTFGILFICFAIVILFLLLIHKVDMGLAINLLVLFALFCVTAVYAKRTAEIASATKIQAEEIKEQRITASRPVIIQKAIVETQTKHRTFGSKDWFSYFEIYNVGNGPAIEIEISLLNKDKNLIQSHRESFLRAGENPIEFSPDEIASWEKSAYYLVSEYKSIFSNTAKTSWYQTWLPFEIIEASQKSKIYVKPGELEFKEVTDNERIDAFSSRSKPK